MGLALAVLGVAAGPAAAQDTAPEHRVVKPWTRGTTHAANEVVGSRSGLDFSFIPPPTNDLPPPVPDLPELTISGGPVTGLVQIVDLTATPPPVNDLPPGPVAVRVRLLPPGPIAPARLELQILDFSQVTLLGPSGEPLALCGGVGGQ
jgi:hypothetical protein